MKHASPDLDTSLPQASQGISGGTLGSSLASTLGFYSRGDEYFYDPQEHGERGPFESIDDALSHAEIDFGSTDGGFWESLEDAEHHAAWMRNEGYSVE
ncbi:MAG: hypothetical protein P8P49_04530 [Opitutales bacterium]|nr:hypothetical protein [Opitutales bacterium]